MLMKQPGTCSSMYEKSSDAITNAGARSTLSAPTSSAQMPAANSAWTGSLTSGAKFTRKSTLAVAPIEAATPSATRRMFASTRAITSLENARTVPDRRAVWGITL